MLFKNFTNHCRACDRYISKQTYNKNKNRINLRKQQYKTPTLISIASNPKPWILNTGIQEKNALK